MGERFDCVVVGCGVAGAAVSQQLAVRGLTSVTIEQHARGRLLGSSGGESRIYRSAYPEGSWYVPYLRRAQELWYELAERSPEPIVRKTGGLYVGPRDGSVVDGAVRSADDHRLPYKVLDPAEVEARHPAFVLRPNEVGFWEPEAGVLYPEACVRQLVAAATRAGAGFLFRTRVISWKADTSGVTVRTDRGSVSGRTLVLTAGPWTASLVPELRGQLTLERQVMFWFEPRVDDLSFEPSSMPVFVWEVPGERRFYGIPNLGLGVKVATENGLPIPRPLDARRRPSAQDAGRIRPFVSERLPGLLPKPIRGKPCVYTNAPDHRFLIGRHPRHRNVVVVSACSGHGFKFGSVVGELVAQGVQSGVVDPNLKVFDPARLMR